MPVHRATFSQPGPLLNPLGVKLPGPIDIEVFIPEKANKWHAREASSGRVVKQAGSYNTPGQARYGVARLFDRQLTPWSIDGAADPTAEASHIHLDGTTPSLCGTRYHQRDDPYNGMLILSELRTGLVQLPGALKGRGLCPVCVDSIDRRLQPGDAVRNTAGAQGLVIGTALSVADEVLVQWQETGETVREKRGALTLRLAEQLR